EAACNHTGVSMLLLLMGSDKTWLCQLNVDSCVREAPQGNTRHLLSVGMCCADFFVFLFPTLTVCLLTWVRFTCLIQVPRFKVCRVCSKCSKNNKKLTVQTNNTEHVASVKCCEIDDTFTSSG
uniref:Uncharacterized protein n=1 Tax=Scophthalmus maximus TaxID=52904 RepID=A0A8D3EDL8_SCOMX